MRTGVVSEIAALAKEAAQHSGKPETKDVLGRTHLFTPKGDGTFDRMDLGGPGVQPQALHLHTLSGLVDYLKTRQLEVVGETTPTSVSSSAIQRDGMSPDHVLVHVVSHAQVRVFSALEARYRTLYAECCFEPLIGSNGINFAFGKYLDLETFNVGLLSLFEEGADRASVLRVTGNVTDERVLTATDDGVTQTVTAKAGTVAPQATEVPNPVKLRPFRTFRDLYEQPESLFVLRFQKGQNGQLPTAALFEADGGKWKLDAIRTIRSYLQVYLKDEPLTLLA